MILSSEHLTEMSHFSGNDVVLIKNGSRICGSGAALATAAVHQDKAYFEGKVQSNGDIGIGIMNKNPNLDKNSLINDAWMLWSNGKVTYGGKEQITLPANLQEGDIVGVTFDHTDLKFYINGKEVAHLTRGAAGHFPAASFPVVYVDDGAVVDLNFASFAFEPPVGYTGILQEQTLL